MSAYSVEILAETSLIGYWRLGDSGGTAADSKGTNNGTLNGTTTVLQNPGLLSETDKAMLFDGSTGYIAVSHNASLNVGDVFSLEAWVKRNGTTGDMTIMGKGTNAWTMYITGQKLALRKSTVADVVASTYNLTDTTRWHHCVITKNGAACKVYIDGIDVTGTITNQTMVDNTNTMRFAQSTSGGLFWNGLLDEVALYNAVLTPAKVLRHYRAGVAANPTPIIVCHIADGNTPTLETRAKSVARAVPTNDIFCYGGDVYDSGSAVEYNGSPAGIGFDGCYGDQALVGSPQGKNLISTMVQTLGNHEYHSADGTTLKPTNTDNYWLASNAFGATRNTRSKMAINTSRSDSLASYNGFTQAQAQKAAAAQWSHANYYDLGGWRFMFLDLAWQGGDEGHFPISGAYHDWVQDRINEVTGRHLVMFTHMTRYTSGNSHLEAQNSTNLQPLWDMAQPKCVAWVGGHNHVYERQLARNKDGSLSANQYDGCIPIVNGVGGASFNGFVTGYALPAAVAFTSNTAFGFGQFSVVDTNTLLWEFYSLGSDGLQPVTVIDSVVITAPSGASSVTLPTYEKIQPNIDGEFLVDNVNFGKVNDAIYNLYSYIGLVHATKPGVPSDADFAVVQDGLMVLDETNNRLYVRSNGIWKYSALT